MANWSRILWRDMVNRAVRTLASGPFGSHFFSALAPLAEIEFSTTLADAEKMPVSEIALELLCPIDLATCACTTSP
ncbi:hypothetical protein KIN20_006110 [Parelaphostrongylus tenuis]|uniref:Uncharacterized protein n=1 Tax=Parelaphostrongylus tenuis TaxID=148309 RepID=A0AAD5MTN0_PARTN|nr:hypothetical protein KIN20_006110 [Parelaphostrongylus tenuis]